MGDRDLGYSPDNARSLEQSRVMKAAADEGRCLFCDLDLERNKPLNRRGEFDPTGGDWPLLWVWANPFPQAHHALHLMIVPRRHITQVEWPALTMEEWAQVLDAWKWAQDHFQIPGGGFVCRFGERSHNAGTVGHLHFQLQVPDGTGPIRATFFKSNKWTDRIRRWIRLRWRKR
jgi:diadenosine tetraphosphate (Ap4A) HIT family hydrolase